MLFWAIFAFIAIHSHTSKAKDGKKCVTPNQETGSCISIYSCDKLKKLVLSGGPENIRFLRNSFCGWERTDPLVCCGTKTTSELQTTNLLPNKETCGFQQDFNKILGGKEANLEEFPWMAILNYIDGKFHCAGILISKRYVLTAGHCTNYPLASVRLGEWNLNSTDDCVGSRIYQHCIKAVDIDVESVALHENYIINKTTILNDIALIRLKNEVKFAGHIQPICLPENSFEESHPGDKLWISGWGTARRKSNKMSMIKQKVGVPIVPLDLCKRKYDRYFGMQITDAQICAGSEIGSDSCAGDSGGPLMATRKENPLQLYAEGIVSSGDSCGTELPGIYTRVSAYLDWIKRNIKA